MKRRGRPPHPDILTPREWEVLELLRAGLSNPEIAERLGVTRDAVKYHVSEILSKLGVATREEAAAWRPYERPWWAAAVAALGGAAARLSPLGRIAAIGASVAALGGLTLLAVVVITTSSRGEDVTAGVTQTSSTAEPTAVPSTNPSASSSDSLLADVTVVPLEVGPPIDLAEDVAVIVETGCVDCAIKGLTRVYRDQSGMTRRDDLIVVDQLDLPPRFLESTDPPRQELPYAFDIVAKDDASETVVPVCVRGVCSGPQTGPDAVASLYHSTDGGITWQQFGEVTGGDRIHGVLRPGKLLVASTGQDWHYYTYPDGAESLVPPGELRPSILSDGRLFWVSSNRALFNSDASQVLDLFPGNFQFQGWLGYDPSNGQILSELSEGVTDGQFYLTAISQQRVTSAYSHRNYIELGPSIAPGTFVAVVRLAPDGLYEIPVDQMPLAGGFRSVPAVVDLRTGVIHPIADFLEPPFDSDRNTIVAIQRGPFARVVNTDGTCLIIRAEPGAGQTLDCAAEGVLLRDLGQAADITGVPWLRVATPAGVEGWAKTQYLERGEGVPDQRANSGLKPPDSEHPAAGICGGPPEDEVATITILPEVPSPRCMKVTAGQRLRVVNRSGHTQEIRLAHFEFSIPNDQDRLLDEPVGSYLATGVHRLAISPRPCCGVDIVLVQDAD